MPKPFRRYAVGPVWRNEKPGPGRFRQFMQFDADTVGAESVAADAEMCMLAADTLEALGIKRGDYVIKVNNRKVLDGLREVVGLAGPENDAKWLTAMRALDKLDRLGDRGVRELLGKGRKDESGDFTPGADAIRCRNRQDSRASQVGGNKAQALQVPPTTSPSLWPISRRLCPAQRLAVKVPTISRCSPSLSRQPDMARTAFASILPSSAGSSTTPAPCSRQS